MPIAQLEKSVAWFEGLGIAGGLRRLNSFGLHLTGGVLGHLALELTATLDFDFGVVQVARHAAAAVDEDVVMADNVFSQNTMYINDLRVDLAGDAAFGADLQIGHCDFTRDSAVDAGAAWGRDGAGECDAFSDDEAAVLRA